MFPPSPPKIIRNPFLSKVSPGRAGGRLAAHKFHPLALPRPRLCSRSAPPRPDGPPLQLFWGVSLFFQAAGSKLGPFLSCPTCLNPSSGVCISLLKAWAYDPESNALAASSFSFPLGLAGPEPPQGQSPPQPSNIPNEVRRPLPGARAGGPRSHPNDCRREDLVPSGETPHPQAQSIWCDLSDLEKAKTALVSTIPKASYITVNNTPQGTPTFQPQFFI